MIIPEWQAKARECLTACVTVDRTALAMLDSPYDASLQQQQRCIREVIFKRRWELEEVASEILAFMELGVLKFPAEHWLISAQFSGWHVHSQKACIHRQTQGARRQMPHERRQEKAQVYTPEEMEELLHSADAASPLWAAHGLPYSMGPGTFVLLSALAGLTLDKWKPDRVENAFLLHFALHPLFGEF
ncbi:hypothetical protein C8J57DRAFT_1709633 [Mycena rebaudengoi]|nr:hypothetical protein C8J57DRAFT_1709633 [Mycena rebaudengoi]